ncbi:MAG TPA: hypothetical protein VEY30_00095 [Myxococcaceae bacterium]|nr:hypothetical protein [Myxococcaceae bacterium]
MNRRFLFSALATIPLLTSAAFAESAGGLTWTAPPAWKSDAPKPMRAATYKIAPAAGDTDPGELAVFYFGPGQGGDVEANVKRWIGQFEQPDGKPSAERAKTQKKTVNGLQATTIDLPGTYTASMGPMSPTQTSKPGYRLLGGIVEGPQGAVFFKLTGPAKTVQAAQADFQKLLSSVKPG